MNAPVEFGLAISNSFPSGTGSFNLRGVIQNRRTEPGLRETDLGLGTRGHAPDIRSQSHRFASRGLELWSAPASNSEARLSRNTS